MVGDALMLFRDDAKNDMLFSSFELAKEEIDFFAGRAFYAGLPLCQLFPLYKKTYNHHVRINWNRFFIFGLN
jgi:hypothetical protein